MNRTVNIEVYFETTEGEEGVFGIASEHRPDLPKPFNAQLQKWVQEQFDHLEAGDSIERAGEMEYEPLGEIIEFRKF